MSRKSLLDRYEPFIASAILGAHANTLAKGFRQHDVRFILEIFTNWVASAESQTSLPVQNTQIARYLDALVTEGFARKTSRNKKPFYRLTRAGLIELITRMVSSEHYNPREYFYFVLYMVESYQTRIIDLVRKEGSRFPYSMQLELESLLSTETIINRQIAYTKESLAMLETRIRQSKAIASAVSSLRTQGKTHTEIIEIIDRKYPFGLSGERRFSDILPMGTEKQMLWEISVGTTRRMDLIMLPCKRLLRAHLTELETLKESVDLSVTR